ncbi:ATP-binding protein [Actinokineospora enzanensis]|uniref:ATP-binding protein n=1 Tax=Actinokineospora enzanensis TaxID=155975 RepID=UPI000362200C|nr:tetratricopeptide repeat protein [Actinokineospora enzanensis]
MPTEDRDQDAHSGEVSNTNTGDAETAIQVGSVTGGFHVHGTAAVGSVPRQLPGPPAGFVDREEALRVLDECLSPAAPMGVAAIIGAPGAGKTALALFWAHACRARFPGGDLYIDMRGYGPNTPLTDEQALDVFLRALGVAPEALPRQVDEKAALYRSALAERRLLVVIDNAVSVRQVRRLLPGASGCLALVTSRTTMPGLVAREGARRVSVDVLSPEDAVRLLAEIVGDDRIEADEESARHIARSCGHLPLALRIVAERAADRPHLRMADLAAQLVGERDRLDALALAEDELTDVRAVFSWSYRALGSGQQATFRALGLHPGSGFSAASVAALVGLEPEQVAEQLHGLVAVHLLQEIGPDRYQLHDLLRAYSRERCEREDAQRARTESVRRVLAWYLWAADAGRVVIFPHSHAVALPPRPATPIPEFGTPAAATGWFEAERFTLLAAIEMAMDLGLYDLAWKLPVVLDGMFEISAYWSDWQAIHQVGLAAARALPEPLGMSANLLGLGDFHWRFGEFTAAVRAYAECGELAERIGHLWLIGFAARGLGLAHEGLGDLDRAMADYRKALAVFDAGGLRRGSGMSLLSMGKVFRALGEPTEAVEHCERAVAVFTEIGDRWSRAWGAVPLTQVYRDLGRFDEAVAAAGAALAIFDEFADQRSVATVLMELGEVHAAGGDRSAALTAWRSAAELFESLGDPGAAAVRDRITRLEPDGG